jgi:hypothetical protein
MLVCIRTKAYLEGTLSVLLNSISTSTAQFVNFFTAELKGERFFFGQTQKMGEETTTIDETRNLRPDNDLRSPEVRKNQHYDSIENVQSNSATPLASPDLNRRNRTKIDFEKVSECSTKIKVRFSKTGSASAIRTDQGEDSVSDMFDASYFQIIIALV